MTWEELEAELHSNASSLSSLGETSSFDAPNIVECADCSKPVLVEFAEQHAENCRRAREKSLNGTNGSQQKKAASSPAKKRRLSDATAPTQNSSPKKVKPTPTTNLSAPLTSVSAIPVPAPPKPQRKLTNSKKAAAAKQRLGHMDPNTQCCVLNENHTPCSRALTCKSHGIQAKRAVQGRTAAFDVLLKEYQEKMNPGSTAKKLPPANENKEVEIAPKKKKKNKDNNTLIFGEVSDSEPHSGEDGNGDSGLDSEEEVEAVLNGLNSKAASVGSKPFSGLSNRPSWLRMFGFRGIGNLWLGRS